MLPPDLQVEPQVAKLISLPQFVADLKRNCQKYPLEFDEQQLTRRITSARKDPLNGMVFALQKVRIE